MAYDGTDYCGFQIQKDQPTIQGEIERALQRLTQRQVRVIAAGRTDTGVHARGQVIHFESDWTHGPEALQRALNAVLPQPISIRALGETLEGFHARFSATSRVYVYSIYLAAVRMPLLDRYALFSGQTLDLEGMNHAAQRLVGTYDFAAFGQPPGSSTVRTILAVDIERLAPSGGVGADDGILQTQVVIEANAFLRGMVRRIVGTLLSVGQGHLTGDGFADILASGDISRAAAPVPACGLSLWTVRYGDEWETPSGVFEQISV